MFDAIYSYALKLWNRGVDVGVGVAISIIVGSIGLLFWKVKLYLDLRADRAMRRQQHRMEDEREQNRNTQRLQHLRHELGGFIARAASARSCEELGQLWTNYLEWLEANELQHLPQNQITFSTHRHWSEGLRRSPFVNLPQLSKEVADLMQNTELIS